MTLSQALQKIRKHWRVLPHEIKEGHEAVWIRIPPEDAAEVYEEWVGMRGDGSLVWAYTSGYSYREGTQVTEQLHEVTVLEFDRKDMPKRWKDALTTFAETAQPSSRPIPDPAPRLAQRLQKGLP
jgi:hypothetical protein